MSTIISTEGIPIYQGGNAGIVIPPSGGGNGGSGVNPFALGGLGQAAIVKAQNVSGAVWLFGFITASISGSWAVQPYSGATALGRMTRLLNSITSGAASFLPSNWAVIYTNDTTQTWKYEFIFGTGSTINSTKVGQWAGLYSAGGTAGGSFGNTNTSGGGITDQIIVRRDIGDANWTFAHRTGSGSITTIPTSIPFAANQNLRLVITKDNDQVVFLLQSLSNDMTTVLASATHTAASNLPASGTVMWPTIGQSADSGTLTPGEMMFASIVANKSGYN